MEIEYVQWIDSGMNITDGWQPVVDTLGNFKYDDMIVESAGFVCYEDDDMLAVTSTWSPRTESAFGLQLIAKSNILKREVVLHAKAE